MRPIEITDQCIAQICEGLRLGMSREQASACGGISKQTFYVWQKEGSSNPPKSLKHKEFYDAIKMAEKECVADCLNVIKEAAFKGNWTAAAWLLERRYPADYGR